MFIQSLLGFLCGMGHMTIHDQMAIFASELFKMNSLANLGTNILCYMAPKSVYGLNFSVALPGFESYFVTNIDIVVGKATCWLKLKVIFKIFRFFYYSS